uniref:AroA_0 protein n=1 Tax=Fopius arisanus TaxID=64838 RepID=A0A0C9R7Y4_9HYME
MFENYPINREPLNELRMSTIIRSLGETDNTPVRNQMGLSSSHFLRATASCTQPPVKIWESSAIPPHQRRACQTTLVDESICINDLQMNTNENPKGRPKGEMLNVIGIPKRKIPLDFQSKSPLEKKNQLLEWILGPTVVQQLSSNEYQVSVTDLNPIPDSFMDESIDLKLLQRSLPPKVFSELSSRVKKMEKKNEFTCNLCSKLILDGEDKSGRCDSCLLWYHSNCAIKHDFPKPPKGKKKWYCLTHKEN